MFEKIDLPESPFVPYDQVAQYKVFMPEGRTERVVGVLNAFGDRLVFYESPQLSNPRIIAYFSGFLGWMVEYPPELMDENK